MARKLRIGPARGRFTPNTKAPGPQPPGIVLRAPMDAPQFAPARRLQSWLQSTPLALLLQIVVPRAPMQAPQFAAARLQQGWSTNLLLTTLSLSGAAAGAWHDFRVPSAPARLPQSWAQSTPLSMQPPPAGTPVAPWADFRLPTALDRRLQSWAQSTPVVMQPPPVAVPVGLWDDFRLPTVAPRMPQSWVQGTPLLLSQQTVQLRAPMDAPTFALPRLDRTWTTNLLQSTLAPAGGPPPTQFRSPMQAPMRLHWERDRSSMSFECAVYMEPGQPVDIILRNALKAPQFPPRRMPQSWTQGVTLSSSQQTVVLRAPMDAPQFAPYRIPQGWTQSLLTSTLSLPSAANWTDFQVPVAPYRLPQSWAQSISLLAQTIRPPDGLYDDFRVPTPWPRMPQSWVGPVPFALSQQTIVPRAPMEAPKFATRLLGWRQAWNANNLTPQQSASPPGIRFRVIGSYIVRHFK